MSKVVADSDESVSDDTLQDDDELFLSVSANTVYLFEGVLLFTTGTSQTPDLKFAFTMPSGATLTVLRIGYPSTATIAEDMQSVSRYQQSSPTTAIAGGVLSTASQAVSAQWIRGLLRVGGTSGTFQVQWAQNTSTGGTPTVRKADSWIRLEPE